VLVIDPFAGEASTDTLGILLGLGAALGYSSFNLLSHRWLEGRSRLVMMAWTFAFGSLLAGAAALLSTGTLSVEAWSSTTWVLLGLIVLFPTFIAVVLYLEGIRGLGPAQAAIVSTLEPLFTIVLAWFLLDQELSAVQLLGAATVLAGVVVAEWSGKPEEPDALAAV
jgi:drug/metabolite transporter (DMT)-like permease